MTDRDPIEAIILNWANTVKAVAAALPTDPVAEAEMDRLMAKTAEGRTVKPITRRAEATHPIPPTPVTPAGGSDASQETTTKERAQRLPTV